MSLEFATGGRAIHMPANPDVFKFDAEVAKIFPDMAKRSIPMYHEAHRAHVAMLMPWLQWQDCEILDVGASRGEFFKHVISADPKLAHLVRYTALDSSQPMLEMLVREFPQAHTLHVDLLTDAFLGMDRQYDIIVCNYIIQFLPPEHQWRVIEKLNVLLRDGGVLVFGHKAAHSGMLGKLSHDEYIEFRLRNGYTRAEIDAKTNALKNSMWPMDHDALVTGLRNMGFKEIVETTRWMMFNTFIALKG